MNIQFLVDSDSIDPFSDLRNALLEYGVPEERLDVETHRAIAASSTISYLHLGRPETILINTVEGLASGLPHSEDSLNG